MGGGGTVGVGPEGKWGAPATVVLAFRGPADLVRGTAALESRPSTPHGAP
jgi:hypothetical protein